MMSRNPCLDAALRELNAAGIRDVERVNGGKHLQLRWRVNGHALRVFTVPGSPSDWRSPHNTRADIRRLLRADGIITAPESASESAATPRKLDPVPVRLDAIEHRLGAVEDLIRDLVRTIEKEHAYD
jgi:hypothetical protein